MSRSSRIIEGPLSKWTNVVNGWQYRWFVLDQSSGLLSYYTVSVYNRINLGINLGIDISAYKIVLEIVLFYICTSVVYLAVKFSNFANLSFNRQVLLAFYTKGVLLGVYNI